MSKSIERGAIISEGVSNWQIFQRNSEGFADISLKGRMVPPDDFKYRVMVRVVNEDTQEPISAELDWRAARTLPQNGWSIRLRSVPSGGLYRIETMLRRSDGSVGASRGDMVHHVGVGEVWLIAGQSNAEGYGRKPVDDGPTLGIHSFRNHGSWSLATHPLDDSTDTLYPENRPANNPSHSPWIAFAKYLKRALGCPIGLIPTSLGGSPLSAWNRKENGILFETMLRCVRDSESGIAGVVWYQGESEAMGENLWSSYEKRFVNVVKDLRRSFRNPALTVITAQLNRWIGENSDAPETSYKWESMRDVQRRIAGSMENVYAIPTTDLPLSDQIHNDSGSNLVIARRMAMIALGAVYGHPVHYLFPDCSSARRVSSDQIELTFENVEGRLRCEAVPQGLLPFTVRDADGDVGVESVSVSGNNRLRLLLGRSLVGPAEVIGSPGAFPSMFPVEDFPACRPMLAFRQSVDGE